jgi:uncharacterized SAM-binding protein YcdF (DUF218 family)
MPDPIWVKGLLKALVLPPVSLLLLTALGLLLLRKSPRLGRALAWTGLVSQLLLALPVVGALLVRSLDSSPPLDLAQASRAGAIVILGGGTRANAPEYGGDTLGRLTQERVRYGAVVARKLSLPVLVSGGGTFGQQTEGSLMRAALEEEFGVRVRWIEQRSRTTHENAQRSAEILKANGIGQVVLVAHSFDMPRARAEFAGAGIDTVPAPTGIPSPGPPTIFDFVPSVAGMQTSYYALYELLANAVLKLRARD